MTDKKAQAMNLFTTREVARLFGVSPATVCRWCRKGRLEAVRATARGPLKFRREEVAVAYLNRAMHRYLKRRSQGE
jgi:excisionase family DNA binding protein